MADPPVITIASSPASTQPKVPISSHRLPTVSASQLFQDLDSPDSNFATTGLPSLDGLLRGDGDVDRAGFARGKVTEVWGAKGAGKTAVLLHAAMHAVSLGNSVMWIDTKTPISGKRLESFVSTSEPSWGLSKTQLTKFRHVTAPTLSHLLAILLHPPPGFFPDDLTLLVVNGANSLVDLDFPRYQLAGPTKSEQQKWQAGRRYAILGSLISAMNKLAMINNMAVVVSTGCSTRMRPDSGLGAALVPGVGGAEWDAGIWTRLVVFCDFNARFVGLQKAQGKNLVSREEVGEVGRIISFDLAKGGGLLEVTGEESVSAIPLPLMPSKPSPVKPRKRNFDEIADSEDEDVDEYGWLETDEDTIAAEGANDAPSNKDDETEPF